MKSLILSIVIFCLLISLVIGDSLFINQRLENISNTVISYFPNNKNNFYGIYSCAKKVENEYKNIESHLKLIYSEELLYELEEYITDMKSYALSEDYIEALATKNRLIAHIEELRRFSSFDIEIIL